MEAATTHPNCLTRPVLTLRESSLCTCALTILVCSLILGLTFGPSFTSEEQLIAGCASLGPMLLLALALYCEYKRQLREEAIPLPPPKPTFPFNDEIPDFNEEPTDRDLNDVFVQKELSIDKVKRYIKELPREIELAKLYIQNPQGTSSRFKTIQGAQGFINNYESLLKTLLVHEAWIITFYQNKNTKKDNKFEYLMRYCINGKGRWLVAIEEVNICHTWELFFRKKGEERVYSLKVKQSDRLDESWTTHYTAEGDIDEILCGQTQITQPEGLKARQALFLLTRDRHPTFELVDPPQV